MKLFFFKKNQFETNIKQFSRFVIIGIINNMSGYLFYLILLHIKIGYLFSLSIAYLFTLTLSYFLQSIYTFKSGKNKIQIIKFYGSYFFIYLLNFIYLSILKENLNINAGISQIIIIPQIAILNFFILKNFVFTK